ncbi:MAG: hypothetical protein IKE34_08675, partial [Paenibacillus sp.]|nr:hypothetical protein [Paenibacillus sp.]
MVQYADKTSISRWRLILGQAAEQQLSSYGADGTAVLSEEEQIMDQALADIYDDTLGTEGGGGAMDSSRGAGQGKSAPRLSKWLG